jgi:uncharacterized protein (TIGR04255 family)
VAEAALTSPFGDDRVEELRLVDTPLVRVVAQVRFPRLSVLAAGDAGANAIAGALRDTYPLLNESREVAVTITPEGVSPAPGGGRLWQLRSSDLSWQVSFGPEFVSLDTSAYVSRDDFVARLETMLACFTEQVAPPFAERIGVRYINRIQKDTLDQLKDLVRPEVFGGLGVPLPGVSLTHCLSDALYNMQPGGTEVTDSLRARWGLLPAGAVLDPLLPPDPAPSWVLDLDSFRVGKTSFGAKAVAADVRTLAERGYRYFRWVVTPAFLARYGGNP